MNMFPPMRSRAVLVFAVLLPLVGVACGAKTPAATVVAPATSAGNAAPPSSTPSADTTPAGTAAPETVKEVVVPASIKAIVDAQDRSPEDQKLDSGRHPAELLAYFGIAPGMKVADLAAGGGYTTELLARAVGASGVVYGQNSKWLLDKFAEKPWSARLTKPVMKNVVRVDRDFEEPLPPEAQNLDAVFVVLFYHDTFWLKVDRDKMNQAAFRALKSGGVYAIVDHSGRQGTASTEVQTLHRIEESVVKDEVVRAGFRLASEADFLRNPTDGRDWNDAPMAAADRRGKSDRFVLKFKKP